MAKEKQVDSSEPMENINDFLRYVNLYCNDSQKAFSRNLSWEHCYEHFQKSYSKLIANKFIGSHEKDSLTLWLAWYLASWGMYRGSSALLNRSYEIHRSVIELLLDKKWCCLNNIKCENWTDETWEKLKDLRKKMCICYGEEISVTDTLFTKILLGTLGCVPAFDEFFTKSISFNSGEDKLLKRRTRTFTSGTMKDLCDFYKDYPELERWRKKNKMKSCHHIYPQMKVLDMGFWNFWNEKTKSNKEA